MKFLKQTLTLFALIAVFSTATYAQGPAQAAVDATANVFSALTIDFSGDLLEFGGLSQGDYTATVSADGTSTTNTGATASNAVGTITGSSNASINVSYNTGVVMALSTDNTVTLGVTPDVILTNGATTQTVAADGTTSLQIDSDGVSDISVGGSVNITSGTATGSYGTSNTGGTPLTITVNYN